MKGFFRSYLTHLFALWIIATYVGGIHFGHDSRVLLMGALALTVIDVLVKPLINILLLPLNLVTLGMLRWVSSVFTLYISTLVVPGFEVVAFRYPGFVSNMFIIPPIDFSLFGAYIILSILISMVVSFLFWLAR